MTAKYRNYFIFFANKGDSPPSVLNGGSGPPTPQEPPPLAETLMLDMSKNLLYKSIGRRTSQLS